MSLNFLLERFEDWTNQDAMVWQDRCCSYGWMKNRVADWANRLDGVIPRGAMVSLEADFSPTSVAALLALIQRACVVVPLTSSVDAHKEEFRRIAQVEFRIEVDSDDQTGVERTRTRAVHPLPARLREQGHPGLVLFTSGSTGKSKAAVHDFVPLLEKFRVRRHAKRMLTFLLFDHIGGDQHAVLFPL